MVRKKNCEVLIGSKREPDFGSVIVFGAGGTSAELLHDTSIGFPPLNQTLASRLMENTSIYEQMQSSKLNASVLEEVLVNFSQLVMDFPEISEVDINPLLADDVSAVAVDARIVVDTSWLMRQGADHHQHMVIAPYPRQYVSTRELKNGIRVTLVL
jgi:acetyltransferase